MLHLNKCCNAKLYSIISTDEPAQTKTVAVVMLIQWPYFSSFNAHVHTYTYVATVNNSYLLNRHTDGATSTDY